MPSSSSRCSFEKALPQLQKQEADKEIRLDGWVVYRLPRLRERVFAVGDALKFQIKNWGEHQHYKNRNPPWIKLKVDILSSRDWVMWSDASRALAIVCMVLASKTGGQIDGSETGLAYLKRAGYLNSRPDLKPLIESGFLIPKEDASKMLADASSSVSVSESSLSSVSSSENIARTREGEVIPDDLIPNEAEIREWLKYKGERKESYKPTGLKALWQRIRVIPPEQRANAINHSMASGWKGIYEQKEVARNGNNKAGYAEARPGKYAD